MDSPGFNGTAHQYGQAFGGAAAEEENWAGAGFTVPSDEKADAPEPAGE